MTTELVAAVYSNNGLYLSKKAVEEIIGPTFKSIAKNIKKSKRFSYPDFGTFTVRNRKTRTGRNPQTGEKSKIKINKTVGVLTCSEVLGDFNLF